MPTPPKHKRLSHLIAADRIDGPSPKDGAAGEEELVRVRERACAVGRPCVPTANLPGTPEKVLELQRRAALRRELFSSEDVVLHDRLAVEVRRGADPAVNDKGTNAAKLTIGLGDERSIRQRIYDGTTPKAPPRITSGEDEEQDVATVARRKKKRRRRRTPRLNTGEYVVTGMGKRIRERREEMGLSQTALALEAGTTKFCIASTELGYHDPRMSTVVAIARALRTSLDWLTGVSRKN